MATTLGSTSLAGALNQDAYQAYLADAISQGQMPQDYQSWRDSYLKSWNVPTDANLDQYNITTTSSDGSQWGGQLGQQVTKQGDANPVFQDSWANGGHWSPGEVALLAGGMFGGGALLANAIGGAAAAGSGLGSLGAADTVTALGSSWSPSALGLTGSIAPGATATEIAALSSGIPGAVGGGLAGVGGVSALGSGMSPSALGLTGVTPGATASEIAGLSQGIPGAVVPTASIGGGSVKDALYGNAGYGEGMTGAQTSAYDNVLGVTGSKGAADMAANSSLGSSIVNGVKGAADLVGGGSNLAALIGAGLGATQGGQTQTSSRDPWAAAQPYLKNLLGDAEAMRANLAANPFTPQQTSAYNNAYAGLDQARAALPGLLSWGQGAMQRQSTVPSYQQLFGGGLLAQQPTAQAGGAGGLLGGDDRMKALMSRGKSLIG